MVDVMRCAWSESNDLMRAYHDQEWGVPERDSRALWEKLMLDGFQAGLSWSIILNKRAALQKAFKGFNPEKVAKFGPTDVNRLLENDQIIRSRAKIEATIHGARVYLAMQEAGDDFSQFVWSFTSGRPLRSDGLEFPAKTLLSERMSMALKKRGFKFCGPVIVYAFMQATGIVNDHSINCFRRSQCHQSSKRI